MKIFGKRQKKSSSTAVLSPDPSLPSSKNEDVKSFFHQEKAEESSTEHKDNTACDGGAGIDIDVLLAMDKKKLNSKQRRALRRYEERKSMIEPEKIKTEDLEEDENEKDSTSTNIHIKGRSSKSKVESEEGEEIKTEEAEENMKDKINDNEDKPMIKAISSEVLDYSKSVENKTPKDAASQLQGLNSKDRRKLLRTWKREKEEGNDQSAIFLEEVRKITESEKEKEKAEKDQVEGASKKKRKAKDLSNLSPEEIERREEQRRMQREAAEKRSKGLDQNNFRHPLNSERRRANRRKPGKAGRIAAAKRLKKNESASYNAGGYNIRKSKGN